MTAQPNPNITVMEELKPISISEIADGKYILDMGQNMVGWVTLNGSAARRINPSPCGSRNAEA